MFTLRALREALVVLLVLVLPAILCLIAAFRGTRGFFWPAGVLALLTLCTALFFRDPRRRVPPDSRVILAPADGRVTEIVSRQTTDGMAGEVQRVSIFLSVFDVHVQRAPIRGRIVLVQYQPGVHLDARLPESGMRN